MYVIKKYTVIFTRYIYIFLFLVQCNSKLKNKSAVSTSVEYNQTPETNKLMNLILNNFSSSGNVNLCIALNTVLQ